MKRRFIPYWISGFIHFVVIGVASVLLVKPVEFAIDAGHASVEVNLVAAAPDPVTPPLPAPEPQELVSTQTPKPDDVVVPVAPPVPPVPTPATQPQKVVTPPSPVAPPKIHHVPTVAKGDGSAPHPGKDAITASADGGALTDAKPDYLSNPPPVYPESSRLNKQEGVVMLEVMVNAEGRPDSVSIENSSGFALLDQAAVTAVNKWRFRPASMGAISVKSRVVIPVRFRLSD